MLYCFCKNEFPDRHFIILLGLSRENSFPIKFILTYITRIHESNLSRESGNINLEVDEII